jgi:hypothetical protein
VRILSEKRLMYLKSRGQRSQKVNDKIRGMKEEGGVTKRD